MPAARFVVVHGRFQPFHLEHLAYCRLGLDRGETLVVGITNFEPDVIVPEPTSPGRHEPDANPFTYWERTLMVRDALLADGVEPERFVIVAFPIHHPDRWRHYLPWGAPTRPPTPPRARKRPEGPGPLLDDPMRVLHVVRVFSEWEAEKVRRLRAAGLQVDAITGTPKRLSGRDVRARIAADDGWEGLVPPAVRDWIVRLDGPRRCARPRNETFDQGMTPR
ncbi:MAG: nicotinate-nucleotide adenylyltransferase [Candidatus Rokubacteria bacterium]|nr:nicotinate-nucleotide adenylyltransferase [Candidatus Rokubacteria bacterium]